MATTPNRSWPTPEDTDLVRDGAAAIRALGDAIDGSVGQGFVYAGTRYYTSSGVFEKANPLGTGDIGLRAIRVRVVGGGGGGAGVGGDFGNRVGGGGSAGGFAERFFTDIAALDASVPVTRGSGGSGGVGRTGGNDGGDTEFGTASDAWRTRAEGGRGGADDGNTGGRVGGIGLNGDFLTRGGPGGGGSDGSVQRAGWGVGGDSFFGGGGHMVRPSQNQLGVSGNTGGGGSGASSDDSPIVRTGGGGGNGVVIVDCFV